MSVPKPILIAGPTASGKSALALSLAQEFGGVVINADSMQVYAELRILTARPTPHDEQRAPHWLYGHVPAREAYSAGRFVRDIHGALERARDADLRPILVGGTGLYFKALLEGLSPVPEIPVDIRQRWRDLEAEQGAYAMWSVLMQRDPEMALRLEPNDGQRIVRALEVHEATGKSLAHWQRMASTPLIDPAEAIKLVIQPDRATLRARANERFSQMVAAGGAAEAEDLEALNIDPSLPAMRAIGVAPLIAAARHEIALQTAIERGQTETRQYIKRQETWMRRYMMSWTSIISQHMESLDQKVIAFIKS